MQGGECYTPAEVIRLLVQYGDYYAPRRAVPGWQGEAHPQFFINDDMIEAIIILTRDLLTGKVRVTPLLSEPQETGA